MQDSINFTPIVANLYMEEIENRALITFTGNAPSHWFRYVDDTWVKIWSREVEAFTEHINAVDNNIKFRQDCLRRLPFSGYTVHTEECRSLNNEVYKKPTNRSIFAVWLSSPTGAQAGGHWNPKTCWDHVHKDIGEGEGTKTCGYQNWTFVKTSKRFREYKKEEMEKYNKIVDLRNSGGFSINIISWFTSNVLTLSGKNDTKDKTPRLKQSNVVYAVQCSQDCTDLYIGETKQPLHKHMAQHRRAISSGQDSAVHLHLKEKHHSFENNNVNILAREDRWFESGVNKSMYVKLERGLWTEEVACNITFYPLTMQYWVTSPDSLTTIHTCAHLVLATHMKAGWVNNPQVALTPLKLRAHTCPKRPWKDTPTQSLKATPLQLVRTEEASWVRGETSSRNWNMSSCLWYST